MIEIPEQGRNPDDVLAELSDRAKADTDWRAGRVFSLVYKLPGERGRAHERLLERSHALYAAGNLLNPMAFKSLKQMEADLVEMSGRLMHCAGAVGTMTSGGTESILCAVAAYRDRARRERPWILRPELVTPQTIHPAFDKAGHYFGVRIRKVPVRADLRADPTAMARAISRNTIGLVASAPQYPHGVVDPIADIARIAQARGLPMHVDACVGGFVLPWLERLGRPIPRWDFRVPGVTSISADLHKYGYAGKGASMLLWRSPEDMKHQFFVATDFPGGVYASPTMLGTRGGGPVAAAWATLQSLGVSGYLELARASLAAAERLRAGIRAIPNLALVGEGDATLIAFTTIDELDRSVWARLRDLAGRGAPIYAVADRLEARGWTADRQHRPPSLHLTVTANHGEIVDAYLADLAASVEDVARDPSLVRAGTAPVYGMAGKLPVRFLVRSRVRDVFAKMYAGNAP